MDKTSVLIVAHGQPSDPALAAAELADLATQVAQILPDYQITSATLATGLPAHRGLVFPMFMAGGWFTRVALAQKLTAASGVGTVLEPFGCDPKVHELAATIITEAVGDLTGAEVLIAAHGSFKSSAPSDVAYHLARRLMQAGAARCEAAFIDQDPQLAQITGFGPKSVCLPFFAARGSHVAIDIPAALSGFAGRILPHLGGDARVPAIIAQAISAGVTVCADTCRYSSNAVQV
jgi:sirohydrochlorin ferrochelatase